MSHARTYYSRQSLRLQDYDYSQSGMYFVTICTVDRACILGSVQDDAVDMTELGFMVSEVWEGLPAAYPCVDLAAFVVMPNHVDGIVVLNSTTEGGQARGPDPTMSLPQVVHRFKSFTTAQFRLLGTSASFDPGSGKLWQRNDYDHVIRNDLDLNRVRHYIEDNPRQWHLDHDNPAASSPSKRAHPS